MAFKHFNESAFGGSSDGMFNLASMLCKPDYCNAKRGLLYRRSALCSLSQFYCFARYLTGSGTEQSFQKAVLYYTQVRQVLAEG